MTRLFLAMLLAGALALPLWAQGTGQPRAEGYEEHLLPVLGETRFLSTSFLPSPFVTTHMRSSLGIGKAFDIKTPILVIDSVEVLGLEGNLLFAMLDAEYQFAVQEWLAVWGRFQVNARLGNELQSVLAQGVSVHNGFELGWLFRVWNNDKHLVSASISLNNASTTWMDIYGFVSDAIDSGRITPDNTIVKDAPTVTSALDLRYAFAASDLVGIQALLQTAFGESVRREESTAWAYLVGLALHVDLIKSTDVPIGLIGGYKVGTLPDGGDDVTDVAHSFLLNVSYTGRRDLGLGVDIKHQRLPLRGFDQTVSFTSAIISMQYYF